MPVVDYIHLVPCACGTLPQGYSVKLVPKQKPDAPVDSAVSQGFETAGVVLVFVLIGLFIDRKFDTTPVFTLVLTLFALVGQFTKMYLVYTDRMKSLEERRNSDASGRNA